MALAAALKYVQFTNYFPSPDNPPPIRLIRVLAEQLGYPEHTLSNFNWHYDHRTVQRFKILIRKKLGYLTLTDPHQLQFIEWFKTEIAPTAPPPLQSISYAEGYFLQHKIEAPTPDRLKRHVQSAQAQFESELFSNITQSLSTATKTALDKLLQEENEKTHQEANDVEEIIIIPLNQLKKTLRKVSPNALSEFINIMYGIKKIVIPEEKLKTYQRKLLLKYHQLIMVETPNEIRSHPDIMRYGMLSIFCYIQQQHMLDALTQVFIDTAHNIEINAESKLKKEIISEVTCVNGKFDILCQLADLAANTPKGIIEKTIYPEVAQEILIDLANELKHRGRWHQESVKIKMSSLYSHHHRRIFLPILNTLSFHVQHAYFQPIIDGVHFIKKNSDSTKKHIPFNKEIPVEGVIKKSWKVLVIEKEGNETSFINRFYYEVAVCEVLQEKLDCKSIWVKGWYRYRNPDNDLPKDFYENEDHYFDLLRLSKYADTYIDYVKQRMSDGLDKLNQKLLRDKKVRIITKEGKYRIKITPSEPQALPEHINKLKEDITAQWPSLSLLDILKETALRAHFAQHFHTTCDHEILTPDVLWKRLLLCLYGIGTNRGTKRTSSGNPDVTYNDLRYVKRRFMTACRIRAAIVEIVNQTLLLRDPMVWGEGNTTVACDSKKINVWDQNLMSQWHARYKGTGVMIYWDVDQKSLCVYSQLKTCLSSEVASMIQGILHHGTEMEIKSVTSDTHGQSLPGFGFSDLLYFTLLPLIKGIQREKLYLPNEQSKKQHPQLESILTAPINWKIVRDNYKELVRYTAALKLGIVDSDIILKRFKASNYQHPVYRALIELGKAIKTIFLCCYLYSEELRIEINGSQNIVERVNGFMDFIFYGKLGEISTNQTKDQELAVLCLHLLQASLTYINTLLIQKILSRPEWQGILTLNDKRALTPILHGHINPYGLFPLDMDNLILIEF